MTPNKPKILYIEWDDARTRSGFKTQTDADIECNSKNIMHEVGFLASETPDAVVLAKCATEGEWRDLSRIPKSCILKRKFL